MSRPDPSDFDLICTATLDHVGRSLPAGSPTGQPQLSLELREYLVELPGSLLRPPDRYTIPYTVYTTGIAWRNDLVPVDIASMQNPYEIFWDTAYKDKFASSAAHGTSWRSVFSARARVTSTPAAKSGAQHRGGQAARGRQSMKLEVRRPRLRAAHRGGGVAHPSHLVGSGRLLRLVSPDRASDHEVQLPLASPRRRQERRACCRTTCSPSPRAPRARCWRTSWSTCCSSRPTHWRTTAMRAISRRSSSSTRTASWRGV